MATFPFTGDPLSNIELIYVGYFGRAGDPAGVNYWVAQDLIGGQTPTTLTGIAASFSVQAEAKAEYAFLNNPLASSTTGPGNSLTLFINQIYQNLFGRNAEGTDTTGGLGYWRAQILTALATNNPTTIANQLGSFILQVAFGAQAADQALLSAKVNVADFFTQQFSAHNLQFGDDGSTSFTFAHQIIDSVHGAGSIPPADALILQFVNNPPTGLTFTLTNGQDTFSGTGLDTFNAPLSGPFGDQPTLTDFDSLVDTGTGAFSSVLNASFDGGHTSAGLNIVGIPVWNIDNHAFGTVKLSGGGPGHVISGLQTLNYNDNGGGASLEIGTVLRPVQGAAGDFNGFAINVSNALGGHHHWVDVSMAAGGFTGTDSIFVSATIVGNAHNNDLDDAYGIAAGSPTIGFQTWHLDSLGAAVGTVNDIALGNDGSSTATTLIGTDDGSETILYASSASGSGVGDWKNLTTIDLSATSGDWTITGEEQDDGDNGGGFLDENTTAFASFTGGSGNMFLDLTAFTGATSGLSLDGGSGLHNRVDFNSDEVNAATAFALFTGWETLGIAEDALGGTVDMAFFPGVSIVEIVNEDGGQSPDPDQTDDFNVLNAPNTFTWNFNATDQNGHDFSVIGVGGTGSTLNVNYNEVENSSGSFESTNYNDVFINISDNGDHGGAEADFYATHLSFVANAGAAEVVTITTDLALEIGAEDVTLEEVGNFVGFDTISLLGGTVLHPTTGTLNIVHGDGVEVEIGVTNAHTINSTGGGVFIMSGPGDHFGPIGDVYPEGVTVTADGGDSLLQGVLGPLANLADDVDGLSPGPLFGINLLGAFDYKLDWSGATANDTLTDTAGGSDFYGDGGSDVVNLGGGGNTVHFGEFNVDGDVETQVITDAIDSVYQGFWGVDNFGGPPAENPKDVDRSDLPLGTSASVTVVNGFDLSSDKLEFNTDAWADGVGDDTKGFTGALVEGDGDLVNDTKTANTDGPDVTTVFSLVDEGDTIADEANVVLYANNLGGGELADAAQLAALLNSSGLGDINLAYPIKDGESVHMLFAYQNLDNGVTIADVQFWNDSGTDQTNSAALFGGGSDGGARASDMVTLVGVTLVDLALHPEVIHLIAI